MLVKMWIYRLNLFVNKQHNHSFIKNIYMYYFTSIKANICSYIISYLLLIPVTSFTLCL